MGCKNTIIPNSVTYIGSYAFSNCSGLTSVTIPNSVTGIGRYAFSGTEWYNNQSDGLLYLDNFLLGYKGTEPTGDIYIAEGTRGIASGAFDNCSGLTSVTIPNSVISIGDEAFSKCSGLTSVTIPNSVTSIDSYAFSDCNALTSITIPNSVTSIGYEAFSGCSGLKDFYCWAEKIPNTNYTAFDRIPFELATLHVPAVSVDSYKKSAVWSIFGNIVALTDDDPKPTGVNSLKTDNHISPEATFSLDGRRLSNPQRGLNIIRMSDGKTKKVMIK